MRVRRVYSSSDGQERGSYHLMLCNTRTFPSLGHINYPIHEGYTKLPPKGGSSIAELHDGEGREAVAEHSHVTRSRH